MKEQIYFKKKFSTLLIFSILFIELNNCKLSFNNSRDPFSKSYWETLLWEEYLRGLCNTNLRASVRLGSGTYKIYPYKLLKLKSGNFAVTAGVYETVNWSGNNFGKNFSFSGTQGTDLNVVAFIVNGKTFQIEWLDYLGQLASNSDSKEMVPITELSNGDVVVSAYTKSPIQGTPISSKSNTNSLIMVRFDNSGNRVWSTYLDKVDNSIVESRFALVTDDVDNIHLFFNGRAISMTPDTNGFGEFPATEVPSNATNTGTEEIGWAIISPEGQPIRQRYLPSYGRVVVLNATYSSDRSIILFGGADDNYVGYTGHPLPSYNYQRPMVTKLSLSDYSILNKNYLGSNSVSNTIGAIYGIATSTDGIYTTGLNSGSFGTSFHPFQLFPSSTNFRNNIFSKFDWNGNLIWNQFLGSTSIDSLEIPPIISYLSESNKLKAFAFSPENGTPYTGLTIPTTGNGFNPLQKTTLNIEGSNGHYQSIHYETSFYIFPPTAQEPIHNIISASDACGGRLVRLQSIIDLNTEVGVMEVATRPASEEP
ncbi:hypothetical protein ND861_00410 [Leptospira sp. 2 VSF19]|uniref:Lipoprotein n=1 Tax=Leptospira soteropolitanensis TaxID=2950025 RepID=A0AAW5VA40_9LEPT|nr:hypothetical protein [Leptospira soteropolitanensis]MCW7491103.1 hypothetical protein [Leptospira soteropolitanensis]MCW7498687.1 hypothetical protein [Leptospira soteropolitanensis]MCW7521720.1 hypothetical protein [Leptospira soteropolitanensis]MCW7524791.1 hypothetical protein [Leptospira soteropolitanensis]MCW7528658.1 hypothetical protein [Leptospira soteropolitanensis]